MTPPPPHLVESQSRLWTPTFMTFLAINFCIFLGFDMLLPTLSLYLSYQGCPEHEIGLIFASFAISSVTSRLLAARLSRAFGATAVVRRGLGICFVGTFMFFVLPHPAFYALGRLMHGAGFGLTSTLIVSMAAQVIPSRRLGEGLGYLGLGATVALAVGPLLGIWVSEAFGYKAMFTSIALCYIAAAAISLTLPKLRLASDAREDSLGLRSFLEFRVFPPASLIMIYGAAACSVTGYLALYCQEIGLSTAAGFFVVSTVGTLAARLTAGRVFDRYGHRFVIPPGAALIILALSAILLCPRPAILYAAAVVYGLGMGTLFPSVQALALSSVSADRRTVASAIFSNAFDLGIGGGAVFLGFLAGLAGTVSVIYLAAIAFVLLMASLYFFFYPGSGARPGASSGASPGAPAPCRGRAS
jgi:predicted MFS family arabinose efflux permease